VKIIRKIEFQMTDSGMEEVFRDEYEYSGPIALAGGGPSSAQNRAADSQTAINSQLAKTAQQNEDYTEAQRNKTTPFYGDLMKNGPDYTNAQLDYAGGTNARAFAPAKAALIQRLGQSSGLPSGYRDQALTDFDEGRATAYDNSLSGIYADRQAAKERGAAGLMGEAQQANPLGYYGAATQGNTSILNANLRKPGIGGIIGGIVGGGANAAAAFA
jgi:hypothetical protein